MANKWASCLLTCLQKSHDPIQLPHAVPVKIGRSAETKIVDPRCSRNQLELKADWKNHIINVKQLGPNSSTVDGSDIGHHKETSMTIDSTLFILSGQYPHRVIVQLHPHRNNKTHFKQAGKEVEGKQSESTSHFPNDVSRTDRKEVSVSKNTVKHNGRNQVDAKSSSKRHNVEAYDSQSSKKRRTENPDSSNKKDKQIVKSLEQENDTAEKEHLERVEAALLEMKKEAQKNGTASKQTEDKILLDKSSSSTPKQTQQSSSGKNEFAASSSEGKSSSTTSSSSASSETNSWKELDHFCVFTSKDVKPRSKIAGFDLDGTIIVTKSGKAFPADENDWKIYLPEILTKLKYLVSEKYKIVFFTNQLGVARGKIKLDELKTKIENIVMHLKVPVQVFIATHEGRYRKPSDGMWQKLKHDYNSDVNIDLKFSFYVGDAAGRPANWAFKKKKDFSCSDRLFALNIGVTFKTPEEFFLNQKAAYFTMPEFDPRSLKADSNLLSEGSKLTSDKKEIILLVGYPSSGKSHFAENHLKKKGYVIVNRDTLGSWQKCVKRATEALVNSSVVVDNTNLSKDERARYIQCATKAKVPCRCFIFTTTLDHCRHNERFRQMIDKSHAKINEIIFNSAKTKFQEPTMSEGFSEIVNVNFVPHFTSKTKEAEYRKFLLEK